MRCEDAGGERMTDKEKAIVMAYTGICMLAGDKLQIFHKYVEDIMGRPIWTHEMGDEAIANEIKEKAKADFIALCADESSSEKPCDDCISRQAAIDAIQTLIDNILHHFEVTLGVEKRRYNECLQIIRELPSVKPEQYKENNNGKNNSN